MIARIAAFAFLLAAPAVLAAAPPQVTVCWGYGCDERKRVTLPESDWRAIRALFSPPPEDAADERERIAQAIARFEQATGRLIGTSADLGGNRAGSGQPYQMDCIDESRNTEGYLRLLAASGLLPRHEVAERRKRAPWLFDQHWTAVIRERDGRAWAVDSWFLDNGKRPHVQRLDAWFDKAALPFNPDASRDES